MSVYAWSSGSRTHSACNSLSDWCRFFYSSFAVELDGTKDWLKLLQCTKLHDIREWNQLDILDE